jgi:hypothetical protein
MEGRGGGEAQGVADPQKRTGLWSIERTSFQTNDLSHGQEEEGGPRGHLLLGRLLRPHRHVGQLPERSFKATELT